MEIPPHLGNDESLRNLMAIRDGICPSLSFSNPFIRELIPAQVQAFVTPSLDCLGCALHYCSGFSQQAINSVPGGERFPKLREHVLKESLRFLRDWHHKTAERITDYISAETVLIELNQDFNPSLPTTTHSSSSSSVKPIRTLIQTYFEAVKKNVADIVPKYIMKYLVQESMNELYDRLKEVFKDQALVEQLVAEQDSIRQRKKQKRDMKKLAAS